MLLDVASGGEMHVALAAGVPPDKLVLHGNAKSDEELATALDVGVGRIVVDSFDEMDRIDRLAGGRPAPVLVRITPGVEAHTHRFTATGHDDTKFGFTVSTGAAAEAVERARGIAVDGPARPPRPHRQPGVPARLVRAGGADRRRQWRHRSTCPSCRSAAVSVSPTSRARRLRGSPIGSRPIERAVRSEGVKSQVLLEPGRAIVATAAVTLYSVITIKDIPGIRTYLAVDGGMSDNPRPVLYGSGYETFLPRATDAPRPRTVTVVGKHCESGDLLVEHGSVPDDVAVGDLLATPVTGAYGHSMGSTYNKVPAASGRLLLRRVRQVGGAAGDQRGPAQARRHLRVTLALPPPS